MGFVFDSVSQLCGGGCSDVGLSFCKMCWAGRKGKACFWSSGD